MLEEWKKYIDETFPDDSRLRVIVFRKFFYNLMGFVQDMITGGGSSKAVLYVTQNLSNQEKTTALTNIGAMSSKPNGVISLISNSGLIDDIYLPSSQYGPVPNFADQLNNQVKF